MGPCFIMIEHLFCLSHRKAHWTMLVDNVGLKICLLGTSNSMVTLAFFPGTSATSNHRFYMAWGRLHGPWCKQPFSVWSQIDCLTLKYSTQCP